MENKKMIYKQMNLVMKDIGSVAKDQKNLAQGYKFRGVDNFVNALYPCLVKHGVFMTTRILEESHELREVTRGNGKQGVDKHVSIKMEYTFHAEDGSSVSSSVAAEGLDSGDKATNKALSAALKYVLIQTFCVPTEDMAEADLESPVIERNNTKSDKKEQTIATSPANVTPLAANDAVTTQINTTLASTEEKPKRSSFRKPKKQTEALLTNGATTGDEWV